MLIVVRRDAVTPPPAKRPRTMPQEPSPVLQTPADGVSAINSAVFVQQLLASTSPVIST